MHEVTELALVGIREEQRLERGLSELDELEGLQVRCTGDEPRYNNELLKAMEWDSMLLCARLVMEAAFGITGLIAAPIYYAYIKDELRAKGLV